MNIIIPLCGIGKRFTDAGYKVPKPIIDVFDKKMIFHVIDNLDITESDKLFIVYHNSLDEYNFNELICQKYNNINLISISKRTLGAAETVLYGIDHILSNKLSNHKQCLIIDCDTIYNTNILKRLKLIYSNAVIYFEELECSNPIYSYIKLEGNNIINIIEKEKISNNANTGAYYFMDINELRDACKYVIDNNIKFKNEYYISCVIKYMLSISKLFTGICIDKRYFISLGTPDDLKRHLNNQLSFLFDLDGTLVRTDSVYFKVWAEILLKYNITLTQGIFDTFIQGNNDMYAMEKLQINKDCYKLEDISNQKDELFIKYIHNIELINGICDFIKNIKKLGYHICIVTNCNRTTCTGILRYMNIEKYINYIVIGNECDKPKPYPDPYLKAIGLLKTTADRAIVFEDSKPGLLSALGIFPKNIVGISNSRNDIIFKELGIDTVISNYMDNNLEMLIIGKRGINHVLKTMIYNSISNVYDIKNIILDTKKLKGGYISDVVKVVIELNSGERINSILKYENDYTSSLTKMAHTLELFDREYYFYENISKYINIYIPKYIGTIKDSNFISKGILLENINKDGFYLNLDLNKENIDVSLKVIEQCAKFHSLFWNKDLPKSFNNLKKHNDPLFKPGWGKFIKERWLIFVEKWNYMIKPNTLKKMSNIVEKFDDIQEHLSTDNLTMCHGDVKSGNIFYKKTDTGYMPYFIDWQYIANGKGVQDISFFIIESFTIDNIHEYYDIFKKYYYVKLREYGVKNYSLEDYNKDFEYAICYFPFFVAVWFGTTPTDELIDSSFPFMFIQKLAYVIEDMIITI